MTQNGRRVVVAMSGGVDSSVAAASLLEDGFRVIGVTLRLHPGGDETAENSVCGSAAQTRARAVARVLGIPHYVVDCRQHFLDTVLHYGWVEYSRGRTPNPCVVCNEHIKFGFLLEVARSMEATQIATGHYVRKEAGGDGQLYLRRGVDRGKDQSYFLFSLSYRQLSAALFPLGAFTKTQVREKARSLGLQNADLEESQDACFSGDGEAFAESLRRRFQGSAQTGEFVDGNGRVLGRHPGIHRFTVGQRKSLGIALGRKAWVKEIDPASASVVVTLDESELFAEGLIATGVRWHHVISDFTPICCSVQVRYRNKTTPAVVQPLGRESVRVTFIDPVRAVTPGQAVVFYDGDRLLGGGWIERSFKGFR
jgi:tRNA-uridine 2-sulfurtransferase